MKYDLFRFLMVLLSALLLMACGLSVDLGLNNPTAEVSTIPAPPTEHPPAPPTIQSPTPTQAPTALPAGWALYRNEAEGFEIAYPASYAALDDANNLSGWQKGVLLLYNQGQSYDIAVQVWKSQAEMNSALGADLSRVTIFPTDARIITVMDITQEPDNAGVIATFRLIKSVVIYPCQVFAAIQVQPGQAGSLLNSPIEQQGRVRSCPCCMSY